MFFRCTRWRAVRNRRSAPSARNCFAITTRPAPSAARDGQLAVAAFRPDEQQVRYVRAGDQEDEPYGYQ